MLRYDNIEYLYLLLLIPIIILAIIIYSRWQKRSIKKFGDSQLIEQLMQSHSNIRKKIKHILFILSITLLIIGLSNPQIGTKMEEVKREGVDLMIAIDLSYSMMAQDIKPNRLERAKQAISRLIDKLEGDRIGLVAFAGTSYLQCPLTLDYSAARIFLNAIDTNLIPVKGTSIGDAIRTSVKAFNTQDTRSRAIILITDGEDHTGEAIESAKWAKEHETKIFVIGIGNKIGAPIPSTNP